MLSSMWLLDEILLRRRCKPLIALRAFRFRHRMDGPRYETLSLQPVPSYFRLNAALPQYEDGLKYLSSRTNRIDAQK